MNDNNPQYSTNNHQEATGLVEIGERLRILRSTKGFTQENVAELLEISSTAYARIERGETDIKYSMLNRLANFYDFPVSQLLATKDAKIVILPNNNGDFSNSVVGNNSGTFQLPSEAFAQMQQSINTMQLFIQDLLKRIDRLENK